MIGEWVHLRMTIYIDGWIYYFCTFIVWGQRIIVLQSTFICSTLKQDETCINDGVSLHSR
jgi:hypothetical protein